MALKFDGFTTFIERKLSNAQKPDGALTVESWIALAAYPWAWSPIADCSQDELTGFFFGISNEGHLGMKIAAGNSWLEVETEYGKFTIGWNARPKTWYEWQLTTENSYFFTDRKVFPIGPAGSGSFGAFYAKLDYYKEWDDLWRVSEVPDIFVRFDESPVQLGTV